jgi:hypothetical protein
MSTGQVVFLIAFAAVVALVTFFALYLLSSTMWGGRWYPRRDK